NVKGLDPGADVRLNGNLIGEVVDIRNDSSGKVVVDLSIRGNQVIHEHATFTIARDGIYEGYSVSIDELPSFKLDALPSNGQCTIRVDSGLVEVGGFLMKDEVNVGQVHSVESCSPDQDVVTVRLAEGTVLDMDMAFVPLLTESGAPGGLVVYDVLAPDIPVPGEREPGRL
ncbi:MAG: MCE family protein, partial [Deltaproteobacteria bacterium]|nr:MCE family protein [Deltaproteobacteria bacterium]